MDLSDVDLDKTRETAVKSLRRVAKVVKGAVDRYGTTARAVVGASLLFHGGEVGATLLLAQTLRQSGLPQLREAGAELWERFESVSEAIEAPKHWTMTYEMQSSTGWWPDADKPHETAGLMCPPETEPMTQITMKMAYKRCSGLNQTLNLQISIVRVFVGVSWMKVKKLHNKSL